MAIIYSYPEIPDVQGGDLLLISDTGAPNKPTRSVDIDDLAAYIGTVIGIGFWNLGTAPDSIFTTKMASIGQDANIASSKLNVYKTDDMTASVPHIATFNESSSNHSLNLWPSPGDNAADIYGSVSRGTFTGSGTVDQIIGSNPIGRHSGSGSVNFIQGVQTTANLIGAGSVKTIVASYAKTFIEGTGSNNIENAFGAWNVVELNGLNDVDSIYGTYSNVVLKNGEVNDDAIGHFIDFDQVSANTDINNAYYIHAKNDSLSVTGEKFFIKDETGIPSQFSNKLVLNAYGSGTFTGTATQRLAVDTNGNVIEIPIGSGPVDGSGTANYTARWIDTDTLGIGALYDNGTNVGIGTNNPSQKLEVIGNVKVSSTIYSPNLATWGNVPMTIRSDDYIRFLTSSSNNERMRILNNGNIGIGTTSPSQKLEVAGNVKLDGDNRHIFFGGNNTFIGEKSNSTELELRGGGNSTAQTVYIDNTGQIGVGTSNPSQKLTVLGIGSFGTSTSQTLVDYDGLNAVGNTDYIRFKVDNSEKLRIKSDGNVGIGTTNPSHRLTVVGGVNGRVARLGNLEFTTQAATYTGSSIEVTGSNSFIKYNSTLGHKFFTRVSGGGNTLEALTIAPDTGNVGIGKTSPLAKLHTRSGSSGVGSVDTGTSAIIESNTTNYLRFLSTDSSKAGLVWTTPGDNFAAYLRYGYSDQLLEISTANSSDGISFSTGNASEKMRILSSGNVGIGTTSPAAKLHVVGTGSFTGQVTIPATPVASTDAASKSYVDAHGGGLGPFLPIAGGTMSGNTNHSDNVKDRYGTGNDFQIWHDGSNTFLSNEGEGHLNIINTGDDRDIVFKTDNGSGATTSYMVIDGSAEQTRFYKDTRHTDGVVANFGNNNDLQIYHDGTNSRIYNDTGDLYIRNSSDNKNIYLQSDNGSGGISSYLTLDGSTTHAYFSNPGKVGIGTTNPLAKLQVSSTSGWGVFTERGIKDGSTSTYSHSFGAGNAHVLGRSTIFESTVTFSTLTADAQTKEYRLQNSSNKLVLASVVAGITTDNNILVASGANIGIGTNSPSAPLHIHGGAESEVLKVEATSNPFMRFVQNGTDVGFLQFTGGTAYLANMANGAFRFRTNNTDQMILTHQGRLGIGTTSPASKLHVAGSSNEQIKLVGSTGRVSINSASNSLEMYAWGSGVNIYSTQTDSVFFGRDAGVSNKFYYYDSSNVSTMLVNTATGRVGIGTTSPSDKLEVYGGNLIVNDGTSKSRLRPSDLYMQQAGVIKAWLRADGNSYLNGGNLGIGTTSPAYILDVVSAGAATARLKSAGTGAISLRYENGSGFKSAAVVDNNGLYRLDATNISLNPTNNVGIGTTNPSTKLHVQGAASGYLFRVQGTSTLNVYDPGATAEIGVGSGSGDKLKLFSNDSLNNGITIDTSGNVGIGTTNPSEKLHVVGYAKTSIGLKAGNYTILNESGNETSLSNTAYYPMFFKTNNSTRMTISNAGNVGIGTTAPGAKLEVSSTDNVAAIINSTNSFTFLDIENDGANRVQIGNASDGKFIIRTADTERMRIDDVGNVGIGITAPTTKLHVNGDIRIQGENELYFGGTGSVPNWEITASGSDLIVNDTGTNVGSVLFNNDEGVALPRLTTAEINAISSPTQGLMAYNTTLNTICFYNGSSWQKVSHANM